MTGLCAPDQFARRAATNPRRAARDIVAHLAAKRSECSVTETAAGGGKNGHTPSPAAEIFRERRRVRERGPRRFRHHPDAPPDGSDYPTVQRKFLMDSGRLIGAPNQLSGFAAAALPSRAGNPRPRATARFRGPEDLHSETERNSRDRGQPSRFFPCFHKVGAPTIGRPNSDPVNQRPRKRVKGRPDMGQRGGLLGQRWASVRHGGLQHKTRFGHQHNEAR